MIVIGVDPGLHTGMIAVLAEADGMPVVLDRGVVDYSDLRAASVGTTLGRMVRHTYLSQDAGDERHTIPIHVVVERFVPERSPKGFDPTPIEVIGELKAAIRDRAGWTLDVAQWHWPLRSEKKAVTGENLRRLHLWTTSTEFPGVNQHINDAARHVVNHLKAAKHRMTLELGWPKPENRPKVFCPVCGEELTFLVRSEEEIGVDEYNAVARTPGRTVHLQPCGHTLDVRGDLWTGLSAQIEKFYG